MDILDPNIDFTQFKSGVTGECDTCNQIIFELIYPDGIHSSMDDSGNIGNSLITFENIPIKVCGSCWQMLTTKDGYKNLKLRFFDSIAPYIESKLDIEIKRDIDGNLYADSVQFEHDGMLSIRHKPTIIYCHKCGKEMELESSYFNIQRDNWYVSPSILLMNTCSDCSY